MPYCCVLTCARCVEVWVYGIVGGDLITCRFQKRNVKESEHSCESVSLRGRVCILFKMHFIVVW